MLSLSKSLLLFLACLMLSCSRADISISEEWMVIADGYEHRFQKGSVLLTRGDSLEVVAPGYTGRADVYPIKAMAGMVLIGEDTFQQTKTTQEWTLQRLGSTDTLRAVAIRSIGEVLTDSMLMGRTLLEQRDVVHQEVYLSPTVIEQYGKPQYFKVRCFGEGAAENPFRLQYDQEGWSVCQRFGQPILQFRQLGFGLITIVDSVKDQRIFGRQFGANNWNANWASERLIAPEITFSQVEKDRFFQLINEGKMTFRFKQLQQPMYLEEQLALEDEMEMGPAIPEKFDPFPISQELQTTLKRSGKNYESYTHQVGNDRMADRAYYLPEDLSQLGLNFEPNHRFSIFSGDRIIRQGLYKLSSDKRWLELNGGCEATAYWHIDKFDTDNLSLSAFIEIAVSVGQYYTNVEGRVVQFDFSLDDRAGPQVQGKEM